MYCRRLRFLMIDALCSYGDQECLNEASVVFARWMKNPDGSGKYVDFTYTFHYDKIFQATRSINHLHRFRYVTLLW